MAVPKKKKTLKKGFGLSPIQAASIGIAANASLASRAKARKAKAGKAKAKVAKPAASKAKAKVAKPAASKARKKPTRKGNMLFDSMAAIAGAPIKAARAKKKKTKRM